MGRRTFSRATAERSESAVQNERQWGYLSRMDDFDRKIDGLDRGLGVKRQMLHKTVQFHRRLSVRVSLLLFIPEKLRSRSPEQYIAA